MIRTRIEKWGLNNKHMNEAQAAALIISTFRRAAVGKRSVHKWRGKVVKEADVQKSLKRKRVSIADIIGHLDSLSSTAQDMECMTPPPMSPTMKAPEVYGICESTLTYAGNYLANLQDFKTQRNANVSHHDNN